MDGYNSHHHQPQQQQQQPLSQRPLCSPLHIPKTRKRSQMQEPQVGTGSSLHRPDMDDLIRRVRHKSASASPISTPTRSSSASRSPPASRSSSGRTLSCHYLTDTVRSHLPLRYQHSVLRSRSLRVKTTAGSSTPRRSPPLAAASMPRTPSTASFMLSDDDDNGGNSSSPATPSSFLDSPTSCYFDSPESPVTSPDTPIRNPLKFRPLLRRRSHASRNLLCDLRAASSQQSTQTQPVKDCAQETSATLASGFTPVHVHVHVQRPAPSAIFEIPEILSLILKHVGHDDDEHIPREPSLARRPPESLKHSVLIHGPQEGTRIWRRSISNSSLSSAVNPNHSAHHNGNLYNCIQVNRLWYQVAREILNENLFFESDQQLNTYDLSRNQNIRCKTFVLHKLRSTPQRQLNMLVDNVNPVALEWIEFYVCPRLVPPEPLFTPKLSKLSIPGCRSVSDDDLVSIIKKAPNIRTLDLRACELITDASLYQVAQNCQHLETLNVGRHLHGELVSDYSIAPIIRACPIKTIGLAGCGISNRTIWELAVVRGNNIERLSLNHCTRLDDNGICRALRHDMFQNLSVLEVRGLKLSDYRSLVEFKRRQLQRNVSILVETCEFLEQKLRETELQMDLEISNRIFTDIVDWLNEEDEEDERSYALFRQRRGEAVASQ